MLLIRWLLFGYSLLFFKYKKKVCKLANGLRELGIKKGDRVIIYMPMVPEAVYAMLATVRIGAIHSVVFAGFSADALKSRIIDTQASIVLTSNVGVRGKRLTALKELVDEAIRSDCPFVKHVVVHLHPVHPNDHLGNLHSLINNNDNNDNDNNNENIHKDQPKYSLYSDLVKRQSEECEAEKMEAEDGMFMLYTSGSTGTPKGLLHTTAGYLTYSMHTCKYLWDLQEGDRFGCVADVGWITGHTYIVYGPLLNGTTSLLFEGTPLYPDAGRYWRIVEEIKLTQFYTAPTAIRTLMAHGDQFVSQYNRSSLRTIGSVGEPINPEAWRWYYTVVGDSKCNLIDTWFQTETGAIMIAPIASATPTKPGSATLPYFGIKAVVLDSTTGKEIETMECEGLLAISSPWPSIARTIFGNHDRYFAGYFKPYPGYFFTGDGCHRDKDGYIWVTGRVDDVINKSGHRLGTAEIESALILAECCAESAVVAIPDDIRGSAIVAFCILKSEFVNGDEKTLVNKLKGQVRKSIGGIAVPDLIVIVPNLPKTRSGKIMRRILRKIACDEIDQIGDVSTLSDPQVVQLIVDKYLSVHPSSHPSH